MRAIVFHVTYTSYRLPLRIHHVNGELFETCFDASDASRNVTSLRNKGFRFVKQLANYFGGLKQFGSNIGRNCVRTVRKGTDRLNDASVLCMCDLCV